MTEKPNIFPERNLLILFILPDMEMGGAERIVTILANHLPRNKFIPKIMLLRKQGAYLEFLQEDIEVIDLKTPRIRHSIKPILQEIRRQKPDIVFSGFGEVNAYLSLFIKLFPRIKFIARETNVVSKHVSRKEIKAFYKFYNNYHKIICQSDDMQDDLIQSFNIKPDRLIKINNPVDFEFIDEKLKEAADVKLFDNDFKNVVAIGNLSQRKGFDNLLKVFSHLKSEPVKLHILGDGRDADVLHRLKKDLNLEHVEFLGRKKNPYIYLKQADLFVLSSRYEGFPNVLLEAGACGTYAISNHCPGGILEIIEQGINGEIGNIEDHEEFSKKITKALKTQHNRTEIRESIQNRFSKDIILKQYEDVLTKIV